MKIQFISKKYIPAAGGAEKSIHSLLKYLLNKKFQISVVASHNILRERWNYPIKITPIFGPQHIENEILKFRPDIIFTQIDWNPEAILLANKYNIPSIHFSRVGDINLNADFTVFNSNFVRDYWLKKYPMLEQKSMVLYPTIEKSDLCTPSTKGDKILCINPVKAKGGFLLYELARSLKNFRFLTTIGWCHPAKEGINLHCLNNVEIIQPTKFQKLCDQSYVLLMPSIWQEPFGRVIIEAMSAGLPVIGHNIGGIPEAMGNAGIILDVSCELTHWKESINKLYHDKGYYLALRLKSIERAKKYEKDSCPQEFALKISELVDNYVNNKQKIHIESPYVNMEWFKNVEDNQYVAQK